MLPSLTLERHCVWCADAGNASPDHIPLGRGFDSSLGYFDHCNDYNTYRPQTPFHNEKGAVADSGPCSSNQSITDLWDTDGPARELAGHGASSFPQQSSAATWRRSVSISM